MTLLWACAPKSDDFEANANYWNSPSPSGADSADSTDSGTSEIDPCPEGLVPIPTDNPQYCIMAYEAYIPESGFGAASRSGVLPAVNVSLIEAQNRCAETPVLQQGEIVGHLRLASFAEWQDAGDGIMGEGGTLFPWGEEPHSDQCVMGSGFESFQESGSAADCHSVFGVYDQIGNIWEWVATAAVASSSAWLQQQAAQNLVIELQSEVLYFSGETADLVTWLPLAVGLNFEGFEIAEDGRIYIVGSPQGERTFVAGYMASHQLILNGRIPETGDLLPIHVDFSQNPNLGELTVPTSRDSEPIGVKVGGAYYSGWDSTLQSIFLGHVPDFDGTIGFRCVSDPIAAD